MPEALAPVTPGAPAPVAPAAPPAEVVIDGQNPPAESAPATAPEGEKPDTDQDPEKQRGTRRFERRLDKAYRRAAEQQARADFLQKQIDELKPKAQSDPDAPKLESFKDIEEYAAATAKHASDKALREHTAKQQSETQKQQQARLAEEWEVKAERGEGKYEDFGEIVGDIKPTAPWSAAGMSVDNADDVFYHLGKNLKEAERIANLPPLYQVLEIGRLSAKLAAEPPKPKTPSRAPAPITPLTGAAPVASDVPTDKDDMRDWMRKRQKQVHGSRK